MNFLRDFGKLRGCSKAIFFQGVSKYLFASAQTRAHYTQKLSDGRYYDILGLSRRIDPDSLTDSQIKRQYLMLIKKYHSDGIIDPQQKLDNEEITKCIILAYDKVCADRIQQKIDKGTYEHIYKDEDEIAMKIFGKRFDEIKYDIFKEGNAQKRAMFMQELQKVRKDSRYYEYVRSRQQANASHFKNMFNSIRTQPMDMKFSQNIEKQIAKNYLPGFGILGVLIAIYAYKRAQQQEAQRQQRKKQRLTLSQEKIKQIQKKSMDLYEKKLNDLINSFVQQQPPSLKYPSKGDPQQIDQLIEYTIGPDINLYEVSSHLLGNKESLEKLRHLKSIEQAKVQFGPELDPFALTKIKVNSAISLSLQAQRCLQNIYIKVKDVADQIEQTGKYIPPKVFFRFYGYLMFQIRQKPLSLLNYRDTEYISLFDLFFDYYSPIPQKRHEYNEYVVGITDEDLKMYGQVHLNHRKIPERYITRDEKIVVMRDAVAQEEHKYQEIWHQYYQKYMRIWRRGYGDRISTQFRDHDEVGGK